MKTWQKPWLKNGLKNWRTDLLPGLSLTGLVILARLLGILQPLEWKALDLSLKWRPAETTDPRITIITITENDIQTELSYPIADQTLADLIQTLQTYNPRVIGIDIFRDKPVGEGYEALKETLQASSNVIAINKITGTPVAAPQMLREDQVGFADAILDDDGYLRRSFLAGADSQGNYHFSLTLRLVEQYLATEDIPVENGIHDPQTIRLGDTEIPRFQPNTGGYVRTDNGGNQTLINFRAGLQPFETIPYQTLMSDQANRDLLEDRIVLVGYSAESVKDFVSSGAIAGNSPSLIPGIDIQAHAISQILSAVYEERSFITALPDGLEYILILAGGLLGIALTHWRRKPTLYLLLVISFSAAWLLLCYGLLVASWWLPLVPTTAAFLLNAIALPLYQNQQRLTSQLEEREALIDSVFNNIHNGPLQRLSGMIRTWPEDQSPPDTTRENLITLNQELRNIHTAIRQEMLLPSGQLIVTGQRTVNLKMPLEALLYEIYRGTLERHQLFFKSVLQVTSFKEMADEDLTTDQKRDIGRFLEEMLLNVYKHAKGVTRLTVECRCENNYNVIRVTDNGAGLPDDRINPQGHSQTTSQPSFQGGYGTKQAYKLARSLGGKFSRTDVEPKGIRCELRWPTRLSFWKRGFG